MGTFQLESVLRRFGMTGRQIAYQYYGYLQGS